MKVSNPCLIQTCVFELQLECSVITKHVRVLALVHPPRCQLISWSSQNCPPRTTGDRQHHVAGTHRCLCSPSGTGGRWRWELLGDEKWGLLAKRPPSLTVTLMEVNKEAALSAHDLLILISNLASPIPGLMGIIDSFSWNPACHVNGSKSESTPL